MNIFVAVLFLCLESTCAFVTPKQSHYFDQPSCQRALVAMIETITVNKPEAHGKGACIKVELKTI